MESESTLWRDCAVWLVKCTALPADHRSTWPNAEVIDLAKTLQDGVVLCQLLHILKPGCLDLNTILRPQMSGFISGKNIRLFLDTCLTKHFAMRNEHLFEASMLSELTNFYKVLECLSLLSKTQTVQARGFPYFPKTEPKNQVEYYNIDSYKNLDDIDDGPVDDGEELFDARLTETSRTEDHIYQDLCYDKLPIRRPEDLPEPRDKREFCIRELLDTERNYLTALEMIVDKFLKPIKDGLTGDDILTVFINIEDLTKLHGDFHTELRRLCRTPGLVFEAQLQDIFEKYRMRFTAYGRYCAELPKAQKRLDELCSKSERINEAVKKCQNETNDGKFRLRDLLSVPMQRILKYHLLLRELVKQSASLPQEQQAAVARSLMIMADIAMYINEVKRDSEMIDLIKSVEDSITDLQMPENLHLTSYGHLHIDGIVRFRPHESTTPKTRHIFVFDRVMLIVKPTKAVFTYQDALIMDEFRVDETVPNKPVKDKWSHQWHVFNFKDHRLAYTMAVKTDAERKRWIAAIKMALDNLSPPDSKKCATHLPVFATFGEPTLCVVCDRLLRGTFFQGYRCSVCSQAVHKECIANFKDCGKPSIRPRSAHRPSSATFSTASTASVSRSPRTASMGTFPNSSNRSTFDFGGLKKSSSDLCESSEFPNSRSASSNGNQENDHAVVQLPAASRNSLVSPISPNPTSPFNPFSPATHGHFTYRTEEEEAMLVYPWFAGCMDRGRAEEFLQRFNNGTFLVRISAKADPKPYKAISVKYDDKPRHIKILYNSDQNCYLAPNKFFKSVPELVAWYETHSLADSFQGMNCTLRIPYKKALLPQDSGSSGAVAGTAYPRAIVKYNFSATSPNMLTIKVGDEVEILGRSGEQRGWWKGRCNGRVGYFPLSYVEESPSILPGTTV
ncbi:Protein vav [Hypsibius exemplaris]|uniref:Protein vav n=1 Tax=Hypsibius exemplaris TaxID=2072580 RepID=A0A1W0WXI8_HYPEX|nr:Protein vav [Hypsibius exemplaris]